MPENRKRYVKPQDRHLVKAGMNIRYRCIAAVTCQSDGPTTIDQGTPYERTVSVNPVTLVSVDVTDSDSWDDVADLAQAYVERMTGKRGYSVENIRSDRKLKVFM
jgi:hypothetical protein